MRLLTLLVVALIAYAHAAQSPIPSFFAPFGQSNGDAFLARNDDGSTNQISLVGGMNFFGNLRQTVFVNNNGLITLDDSTGVYTPIDFTHLSTPTIGIYWADVDTRNSASGLLWYRSTIDSALAATASQFIRDTHPGNTFVGNKLFIATWDNVGYYGAHADKLCTFQMVLIASSDQTYAIFNYGNMEWTTGDASGGSNGFGGVPAYVGFAKGSGGIAANLASSGTAAIVNVELGSNVDINGVPQTGRYVFSVGDGLTISACCDAADAPVFSGTPTELAFNVATIDDVPPFTGTVTVTSQCTTPVSETVQPTIFEVFGCPVERTWRFTDDCGRTSSVTQVFTYPEVFTEELSMTVPPTYTFHTSAPYCEANALPSPSVSGMASSNRGVDASIEYSDSSFTMINGVCTLNRFWIATDICRKQVVGQQAIIASTAAVDITTGSVTTGALMPPAISVQEYCAGMPIAEGDQKFYCSADHLQFYQCLTGAFNSQSAIMNCPAGLRCNCAPGVSCDPVCDWPSV